MLFKFVISESQDKDNKPQPSAMATTDGANQKQKKKLKFAGARNVINDRKHASALRHLSNGTQLHYTKQQHTRLLMFARRNHKLGCYWITNRPPFGCSCYSGNAIQKEYIPICCCFSQQYQNFTS